MPVNLHSSNCSLGNGLKDAIWRCDRILSEMGLKMPSGGVKEVLLEMGLKDAIQECLLNCYVVGEWTSIRKVSMFGMSLNWGSG